LAQSGNDIMLMDTLSAQNEINTHLTKKNLDGITPMHVGAATGNENLLSFEDTDLWNASDNNKFRPIHYAAYHSPEFAQDIISSDMNSGDFLLQSTSKDGLHVAHVAAYRGRAGLLVYLSTPEVVDSNGNTPLHYAADFCSSEEDDATDAFAVVSTLLSQSWNPQQTNIHGETFLYRFVSNPKVSVEDIVSTIFRIQNVEPTFDINAQTNSGVSCLHIAAFEGRDNVVESLLELHANVNLKDAHGRTSLHYGIFSKSYDCCRVLLDTPGVDPLALDRKNRSTFHTAAFVNSSRITGLLTKACPDVNPATLVDSSGSTPLSLAQKRGNSNLSKILNPQLDNLSGQVRFLLQTNSFVRSLNIQFGKLAKVLYIAGRGDHRTPDYVDVAIAAFRFLDKDGSGLISKDEFEQFLRE
jgi:ankyrin repeat protein